MSESFDVVISKCIDYTETNIKSAMDELLANIGGLDFIKPNMKVVIKANLVASMNPDKAATTHPNLLKELCIRIMQKGASVTIGDSPGGPYSKLYLNQVYKNTGLKELEKIGVKLNDNFSESIVKFPQGLKCKEFPITSYLLDADVIINFCKLKSHGMMALSCGVKNFFGIIPGTIKPEFHFRYPDYNDFANVLIDLNQYIKPSLTIVDAVVAMEGNGPTAGNPKNVGLLLASKNQYKLDYICAKIIGLEIENVPTLEQSYKRGLITDNINDITCNKNIEELKINDFDLMKTHRELSFTNEKTLLGKIAKRALKSKPEVNKKECVGCEKCKNVCPAKAITMKDEKPVIDRKKCITCFCCQEFCPKGAMKVKRTFIAKLIEKGKS